MPPVDGEGAGLERPGGPHLFDYGVVLVAWLALVCAWLFAFPAAARIDGPAVALAGAQVAAVAVCAGLMVSFGNRILLSGITLYGFAASIGLLSGLTAEPSWWAARVQPLGQVAGLAVVAVGVLRARRWYLRERREAAETQRRLYHVAHHDPLTDLPNRGLFNDRLLQALARGRREDEAVAVHFVDVDDFKRINDVYGHEAGDRLLRAVGERLDAAVRETDTVSRWGGDEFVIIQGGLRNREGVEILLRKILKAMEAPVMLGASEYTPVVSIGTSIFPDDGVDADELLRKSDIAMYAAKRDPNARHYRYHRELVPVDSQANAHRA